MANGPSGGFRTASTSSGPNADVDSQNMACRLIPSIRAFLAAQSGGTPPGYAIIAAGTGLAIATALYGGGAMLNAKLKPSRRR